jgi:hypothetical protein
LPKSEIFSPIRNSALSPAKPCRNDEHLPPSE